MPEDVCDYGNAVLAKEWQLLTDKGAHTDILKPDRVDHSAADFAHPRRGSSRHRLERKPLYHDGSQSLEIQNTCEFDAVTKCAARGNDGIGELEGANRHTKVNGALWIHCP